ncbi:M3 family oligoendopeptidase [Halobacillus salinus]|uniref:M3 family oligoendopeptidase n=1 Tax=Halobacillus salinus TaxID=192814 RepID=UPI001591CC80|nr:M3 family oligoendopeptidase [Halobacillus salinus]
MNTALSQQWDLDSIYSGGEHSESLRRHIQDLNDRIPDLHQRMKEWSSITEMKDIILDLQDIMIHAFHLDEFSICLASQDTKNQDAAKWMDKSQQLKTKVEALKIELDQLFKSLSESDWNELLNQEKLQTIRPFLHRQREKTEDQALQPIENSINQLSINGITGWEDHYEQLFHDLRVPIDNEELSINQAIIRSMLDPDRETRKRVAEQVQEVCKTHAAVFASIFNHFAGFRLDTYRLREWSDVQIELFEKNKISSAAVEAMMQSIQNHQEKVQAFLKRKAHVMGLDKLSYYDLHLPAFSTKANVTYEEAATIIQNQFASFSEKMGSLAETAFHNHWIDAEARKTKAFGGFCASIPLKGESRILVTFENNYHDLVTLAHELGHAYHNSVFQPLPGFARETGTGLAETASTFAENLVLDAAKQKADDLDEELALLEMQISTAIKYITLIPSKYDFERQFYKRRSAGKLTADELKELMIETEQKWTNDGLSDYDGYSWMTIPHFYDSEQSFYNIPYTIGYLFSNGLYALASQEGFQNRYEELLAHTGSLTMDELADTFLDEDITSHTFWDRAIEPVMSAIDEFLEKTKKA